MRRHKYIEALTHNKTSKYLHIQPRIINTFLLSSVATFNDTKVLIESSFFKLNNTISYPYSYPIGQYLFYVTFTNTCTCTVLYKFYIKDDT